MWTKVPFMLWSKRQTTAIAASHCPKPSRWPRLRTQSPTLRSTLAPSTSNLSEAQKESLFDEGWGWPHRLQTKHQTDSGGKTRRTGHRTGASSRLSPAACPPSLPLPPRSHPPHPLLHPPHHADLIPAPSPSPAPLLPAPLHLVTLTFLSMSVSTCKKRPNCDAPRLHECGLRKATLAPFMYSTCASGGSSCSDR